jgi:predicted RNA binding protein YcfA (HicA-like mRNA interferase family)
MSRDDKLLEKWRNNPRGVRFEELDRALRKYGFEPKQPRGGSSHTVYRRPGRFPIVVAHRKPFVNSRAVKEVLQAIEEIEEQE